MKNFLLFFLALAFSFTVSAQKTDKYAIENSKFKVANMIKSVENETPALTSVPSSHATPKKSPGDVTKVLMGASLNGLTLLIAEQTCMFYNAELDAIMGTFRGNPTGTIFTLGTGNDICTYWSTDKGATFTGKITFPGTDEKRNRYPSGAIYNLPGNTDLNQAFAVHAVPVTIPAGGWPLFGVSCIQYNGDNFDSKYFSTTAGELVRQGLTTTTNGYAHACTQKYDATAYTWAKPFVVNGKFNSNTFVFEWDTLEVHAPFKPDGTGAMDAMLGQANMAWNKDGSIGYLLSVGVDSRAPAGGHFGYYPILHKSTDNGKTWNLMDYFDFSVFPEVSANIWDVAGQPGVAVPFFDETDIVVDSDGNPHVFAKCVGQSRQHPDSLGYTYTHEIGSVFEFYYTGSTWKCNLISKLKSGKVPVASSPLITGTTTQSWDNRVQASRTDDGKKVFCAWTDTDWTFWAQTDSINLNPDLMIWGRDVTTNKHTVVKNITELTDAYGVCFFMFASPITRGKDGVYDIPVSISDINTYTPPNFDKEIYHYFLGGASLSEADFSLVGVDKGIKTEGIAANVYPNPFKGQANVSISLDKPSNVNIVISSITGKQVKSINYGNLSGKQNLKLDGSNLPSGVYFCTITAGDKKVTNKLVIK